MKFLTAKQHRDVVRQLVAIPKRVDGCQDHAAGPEYTSVMVCFMMHSVGAAESLLALHDKFGDEWFPATTAYVIVRSLFEIDINAHYISVDRANRSHRYMAFEHVIQKNALEVVERHRTSQNASWRMGMQMTYDMEYAPKKRQIESEYNRVRTLFEDSNGKRAVSWSGKSIRAMAKEVDHSEAYDVFYAHLCSFAHVNVELANRFLACRNGKPKYSMGANDFDVGSVFRYAAIFLTCFLELFGNELGTWSNERIQACWQFSGPQS